MPDLTPADLSNIKLLSELHDTELASLFKLVEKISLSPDEVLIRELHADFKVYFLVSGRMTASHINSAGKEVVLRTLVAGDVIGDYAAVDGIERAATVRALEPSVLVAIEREDFINLIKTYPDVAYQEIVQLVEQVRLHVDRICELSA